MSEKIAPLHRPKAYAYIRMSTEIQSKGDSLRRQLVNSVRYAEEHSLELCLDKEFHDIGVSAFRSLNAREGALRRFLDEVQSGQIARGSYLLIESLDRLSRDQVGTALIQFLSIIEAGITIVTTGDRQVYTKQNLDAEHFKLMFSIMEMSRSNRESEWKSTRLKGVWEAKRSRAREKKMTSTCPHWLELSPDRSAFKAIPDRVKIVKRIFNSYVSGLGVALIAKRLNEEKVPTWGRTNGWRDSYIKKLLCNRAVLGELSAHKMVHGVRTLVETFDSYYPSIIEPGLFQAAQTVRTQRQGSAGRKGKQIANLFSHVVRCGYCGGKAYMKDGGRKNGKYIVCDHARRGLGCVPNGFPYESLEKTFLSVVQEVNLAELFSDEHEKNALREVEQLIFEREAEREQAIASAGKLLKVLEDTPESRPKTVMKRISELENLADTLEAEISRLRQQAAESSKACIATREYQNELLGYINRLDALRGDEKLQIRAKAQHRITTLVERIELYPLGRNRPEDYFVKMKEFIATHGVDKELSKQIVDHSRKSNENKDRMYLIVLKSSRHILVTPSPNNPVEAKWVFDPV